MFHVEHGAENGLFEIVSRETSVDSQNKVICLPKEGVVFSHPGLSRLVQTLLAENMRVHLFSKKEVGNGLNNLVLSCLAMTPFLARGGFRRVLDLGGGNGLPALVMALAFPEKEFVVVEASEKRVAVAHGLTKKCFVKNVSSVLNPVGPHFRPMAADAVVSKASDLWRFTWNNPQLPQAVVFSGSHSAEGCAVWSCLANDGRPLGTLTSNIVPFEE